MNDNVSKRLQGKIAAIIGSTSGIGYAMAEKYAQEGAKVIICGRKQENVDAAMAKLGRQGLKVTGVACHVAKSEDRTRLLDEAKKLGGLDILVVNAAVNPILAGVIDCPESIWDKIFDVNVKAAFMMSKEALPMLKLSKAGRIIYMSSAVGYFPLEQLGAYAVSKTALFGLTKMAAVQLGKYNITVNCIAPGAIDTSFLEAIFSDSNLRDSYLYITSLRRLGKPEDVPGTAVFLATDEASYITGETIEVSGGFSSRL